MVVWVAGDVALVDVSVVVDLVVAAVVMFAGSLCPERLVGFLVRGSIVRVAKAVR